MRAKLDVKIMTRQEVEEYSRDPKNRWIVAIPILLVLSFIFYVLAGFFSYLGGSGEEGKKSFDSDAMTGVSDFNAADNFKKIQMAIRIMPSH